MVHSNLLNKRTVSEEASQTETPILSYNTLPPTTATLHHRSHAMANWWFFSGAEIAVSLLRTKVTLAISFITTHIAHKECLFSSMIIYDRAWREGARKWGLVCGSTTGRIKNRLMAFSRQFMAQLQAWVPPFCVWWYLSTTSWARLSLCLSHSSQMCCFCFCSLLVESKPNMAQLWGAQIWSRQILLMHKRWYNNHMKPADGNIHSSCTPRPTSVFIWSLL